MFKFVTQNQKKSTTQTSTKKNLTTNCDLNTVAWRSERVDPLSHNLNKQRHKRRTLARFGKKGSIHTNDHNLGLNLTSLTSTTHRYSVSTPKTNYSLSPFKNVDDVTGEDHIDKAALNPVSPPRTTRKTTISRPANDQINRHEGSNEHINVASFKVERTENPIGVEDAQLNSSISKRTEVINTRPRSAQGIYGRQLADDVTMTNDYYSFSDTESDITSVDQPSPILLTSTPPRNAVKVPATKYLTNGWGNKETLQHGLSTEKVEIQGHEDEVYVEDYSIQQEASNLFCTSLRKTSENARYLAVPTKPNRKKLREQEPHFYSRNQPFSVHKPSKVASTVAPVVYSNGNKPKTIRNVSTNNNGFSNQSSGTIFVGGPLFFTVEECAAEYNNNSHSKDGRMTIEESNTVPPTITESLYRFPSHKGLLYASDIGTPHYNDMNSKHSSRNIRQQSPVTMNGNMKNIHTGSGEEYDFGLISVEKANIPHQNHTSQVNPDRKLLRSKLLSTPQAATNDPKYGSCDINMNWITPDRHESYFSMSSNIASTTPALGEKEAVNSMGTKNMASSRYHDKHWKEPSDDEDDDATTLTMVTTSDDDEELSSSSSGSESTTCGSIESERISYRSSEDATKFYPSIMGENGTKTVDCVSPNDILIQKVEHVTRYNIGSPEHLRSQELREQINMLTKLRRSISTQSENARRERLNAVTEDDFSATRVSGEYINDETGPYRQKENEQYTSDDDQHDHEMPSLSHYSPSDASSQRIHHTRISQLKEESGLESPTRSRTLNRVPVQQRSAARSGRCRSLDRGLRSSFTGAISPTHSDVAGVSYRSRSNSRTRNRPDSRSNHTSSPKGGSVRRTTSLHSFTEGYKPSIDVAASLSELLLNPDENEIQRPIHDTLKHSSRNHSKDKIYSSAEELWENGRYAVSLRAGNRSSMHSSSASSFGMKTPTSHHTTLDGEAPNTSLLFTSVNSSPHPRESKVITKSQTADRYPAVEVSPRSISSLLPSPRRNKDDAGEIITILDNEALDIESVPQEGARRNSFLEAVRGSPSENTYCSYSRSERESSHESGEDVLNEAWNQLTHTAEEQAHSSDRSKHATNTNIQNLKNAQISLDNPDSLPSEVNVNLYNHPISKDLTVTVIRKPSTLRKGRPSQFHRNDRIANDTPTNKNTTQIEDSQPVYMNLPAFQNQDEQSKEGSTMQVKDEMSTNHEQGRTVEVHKSEPLYMNLPPPEEQKDDSLLDIVTVKCRNPQCRQELCLEDAKSRFKSCHHCYTYYCSQECRLSHWEKHKLKCIYARVNSDCKKILRLGREDDIMQQAFTRVARTGYLSRGRGCVRLYFTKPDTAERFIAEGLFALESLPIYHTIADLADEAEKMSQNQINDGLIHVCDSVYNPEKNYVLQVSIEIPQEVQERFKRSYRNRNTNEVVLHAVNTLYKSDKDSQSILPSNTAPETLILTPPTTVPELGNRPTISDYVMSPSGLSYSTSTSSSSAANSPLDATNLDDVDIARKAKRARQLSFINIQRKLREKGVTLRHQYPDVYRKLCAYVATGTHFTPVVIYPKDTRSGKSFMCLVMPGSEPQILGWVRTPGLLDDLATG